MSTDYLVSSLQPLAFDAPPPYTAEAFAAVAGDVALPGAWHDLVAEIRNVLVEERLRLKAARGEGVPEHDAWKRPADGCHVYWQNRARQAMAGKDPRARADAVDRLFWDAAGELTPADAPLGPGALATYAIRLAIAQRRAARDEKAGREVFDRLTATGRMPDLSSPRN